MVNDGGRQGGSKMSKKQSTHGLWMPPNVNRDMGVQGRVGPVPKQCKKSFNNYSYYQFLNNIFFSLPVFSSKGCNWVHEKLGVFENIIQF